MNARLAAAAPAPTGSGRAPMVGSAGALLVAFCVPLIDTLKTTGVAGIFGDLHQHVTVQLNGVVAVGVFLVLIGVIAWKSLTDAIGLRVGRTAGNMGLDRTQPGAEARPDRARGSLVFRRRPSQRPS